MPNTIILQGDMPGRTGLAGTVRVWVYPEAGGAALVAGQTAGVAEYGASGNYLLAWDAPDPDATYAFFFDDGAGHYGSVQKARYNGDPFRQAGYLEAGETGVQSLRKILAQACNAWDTTTNVGAATFFRKDGVAEAYHVPFSANGPRGNPVNGSGL